MNLDEAAQIRFGGIYRIVIKPSSETMTTNLGSELKTFITCAFVRNVYLCQFCTLGRNRVVMAELEKKWADC